MLTQSSHLDVAVNVICDQAVVLHYIQLICYVKEHNLVRKSTFLPLLILVMLHPQPPSVY